MTSTTSVDTAVETTEHELKEAASTVDLDPGLAPMGFRGVLRNLLGIPWGFTTPFIVFSQMVFPVAIALLPFGVTVRFCEWLISYWVLTLRNIFGLEFDIHGLGNIEPGKSYVIVANHRSWLDALALLIAFKRVLPFAFVIKKELVYIPLAGWYMLLAGYEAVERGSGKARGKLTRASKRIQSGTSILVFPEGTRAPSHKFVPCKKGAAILARDAGVELLPVVISGTARLMPKKTPFVRSGRIRLEVLPPLEVEDPADLVATTRQVQETLIENYRLTPDSPKARDVPGLVKALTP